MWKPFLIGVCYQKCINKIFGWVPWNAGMAEAGGLMPPPRFWQIRTCRITTCPPRFADLPPIMKWMTFRMGLLILDFCDNRTSIEKTHGPGQYGMYFGLFVSLLQTQSLLWTRHLQYFFHFWIWCSPNQHGLPLDFLLWLLWQNIADMIKCCRCEYNPLQIKS